MNIETKEFWLKVKEEYQPDDHYGPHICLYSQTFENAWDDTENETDIKIINKAKAFLREKNQNSFTCSYIILFYDLNASDKHHIEIRKQFIDHMIQISK